MEKKEVKFVRLYASNGKKLKVTAIDRYKPSENHYTLYCDDGHIMPEDEIVLIEEVCIREWEEARKDHYCCARCF